MEIYQVIQIDNGLIVFTNNDYNLCLEWLDQNGDLINYTIIQNNI